MLLCSSYSNAQVDSTTGNLINYGTSATDTTSKWNNGVYVNSLTCWQPGGPGNCGPYPNVNQNNGAINFSYGQVDLNQVVNINRALAAGGSGVQLSGFNFAFTAKNGNGWDNGQQDYLSAYVKFYNAGGGVAATYDYTSQTNRKYNWTNFSFSETFANPVAATNYSNAQVGFIGRDTNGWAGPYGPEIINVNFALKYRVDPCTTNIAYSPTCAGYNTVTTSSNIFNSSVWANAVTQSVAINTALKNGGIGATVYGINYGFDYNVGQSWSGCTATNQDGSCSWYMNIPAQVSATARLTNSDAQTIFSKSYALTGDGESGSVSGKYLLPTSLNQTGLGKFSVSGSASGTGSSIGNFSASLIYTADPCVSNPLYNASCTGYAVAYAKNTLLGSTVASASGPVVSSGSTSISTNTGTIDQSNPQTQQAQQSTTSPPPSSPAPAPAQDTTMAQMDPASPSPTQAGPAPTSPQPAGGPPQTATASAPQQSLGSQQAGPSGGGGPSKLAMSVVKTAQANDKATQQMAVQNAAKVVEGSTQQSQATTIAAITLLNDMSANSATAAAQFSSQLTQASAQSAQSPQAASTQQKSMGPVTTQFTQTVNNQANQTAAAQNDQITNIQLSVAPQQMQDTQPTTQTVNSGLSTIQLQMPQRVQDTPATSVASYSSAAQLQPAYITPPQQTGTTVVTEALKPPVTTIADVAPLAFNGTGLTVARNNPYGFNLYSLANTANIQQPIQQPAPAYQFRNEAKLSEVETPPVQIASFGGSRAGNPLADMMQQRFEMLQTNIEQRSETVKRDVQPNELAGGVDIASMATQPKGFEAYSFIIKDSAFYEPKEVYRGQTVVDNVRALRQMSSDRLHKEMVDSQYKQGE